MAEDRDKILNELIEYYDGGAEPNAGGDMESTRVIGKKPQPAKSAAPGDTVVVGLGRQAPEKPAADSMGGTRRITPEERGETPKQTSEPQPIREEVLGSLGIDGRPLCEPLKKEPQKPKPPAPEKAPERPKPQPENQPGGEEERRENYGLWYMLKPLWVTLIICAVIFAGWQFYMTDTGVIGAYKRNFEYNMSALLDLLGIDADSTELESPVTGEQTGAYVTLADDEELIKSFGTDIAEIDGSADARGVLTAANVVPEEGSSEYREIGGGTVLLPFEKADSSDFAISKDGVVCAKANYICCVNDGGETVWEAQTPVTSPIVCSAGKYVAVAARGSTQLCVFENGELLCELDADGGIADCDISERGDTVVVTDKTAYKGAITVYNRNGEKIFSWASGTNYITAVSMLKTRLIAAALVSTSESVTSYVMLFDIASPEPIAGFELENTLIFDVENNGKSVFPTGDNCIASLTGYGGINYDMRFDDVRLARSALDGKGNRLVSYTQNGVPVIALYNGKGELLYDAAVNAKPDFTDIRGSVILYNDGRDIYCGKYSDAELSRYTAAMSINSLMLMDGGAYVVVYSNSLEIVKL